MLSEGDVDRIWFGCGNFGGIGSSPALRSAGDSEDRALTLLDQARRVGLRRFDTANTYGGGASEIILGKWLRSQGVSFIQSAQIATKVVSNASLADVEAVRRQSPANLAARFEYVQNEFNLLATADAEGLIPYCAERGLRYTAFSPLAGGLLTGKYRFGEDAPSGSRLAHAPQVFGGHLNEETFAAIERLRDSADALQVTMAEAALRFVLDTRGVDGLIIAPRRIEHFASLGFAQR